MAAVILINGAFDRYPVEQKIVTVSRKIRSSGGRSGTHYRIEFTSWRRPGSERLEVRRITFDGIHTGDSIAINVHHGALGVTWIGAINLVAKSNGW